MQSMFFSKSGKERKYAVRKNPIRNSECGRAFADLTPQKLETALAAKEKRAGELDLSRKLTRAECARILGVSVNSVHRYIQNGYLRAINISPRLVRIDPESVQELLTNGITAREK